MIEQFFRERGLQHAPWREKAEALGVGLTTLFNYMENPEKKLNMATAEKVLRAMGGGLVWDDARPLVPPPVSSILVFKSHGHVSAGMVTVGEELEEDCELSHSEWRRSPFWNVTVPVPFAPENQDGVVYLTVRGDSMSPDFPDGCRIACRAPIPSLDLPDQTPAILETDRGETTFKLLQIERGKDNRITSILAIPINIEQKVQVFKPKEVRVLYVVLGRVVFDVPSRRTSLFRDTARRPMARRIEV
jgi:hypothetical protein